MRKYLLYLLMASLAACQQEPVELVHKEPTSAPGQGFSEARSRDITEPQPLPNSAMDYGPRIDWSGTITTQVWSIDYQSPPNHPQGYVQVPSDFVLIGGGAYTMQTSNNAGAFLTGSWPDWDASPQRWWAASKDHVNADPHVLRVYAVGLKLAGVSAATLKSEMKKVYGSSPQPPFPLQSHPNWLITMPSGYKIVGGGAKVNWTGYGNLLYKSWPEGQNWIAESKDHIVASPAWIEVWALGIPETIPGFNGIIEVITFSSSQFWNTGPISVSNTNYLWDYAQGCPIGKATWSVNEGRMLCSVVPGGTDLWGGTTVTSKDITIQSEGYTYAGSISIRKKP